MAMSITNNVASANAQRNLFSANRNLSGSMSKLSSGLRITKAADDAAGLAISEKMRGQIKSLNVAARNAGDAVNMIQTADGGAAEITNMLHRMKELAVQGASDALGSDERGALVTEITQLRDEINNITDRTTFNGKGLLNGSAGGTTSIASVQFQIGSETGSSNMVSVSFADMDATALAITASIAALSTAATAAVTTFQGVQTAVDTALDTVNTQRATFGAVQNRLEYAVSSLKNASENLTASESAIRDVDVAAESANLSRNTVLTQAAVSVLAQANQQPQMALRLIG